jgi:hypothetical protein
MMLQLKAEFHFKRYHTALVIWIGVVLTSVMTIVYLEPESRLALIFAVSSLGAGLVIYQLRNVQIMSKALAEATQYLKLFHHPSIEDKQQLMQILGLDIARNTQLWVEFKLGMEDKTPEEQQLFLKRFYVIYGIVYVNVSRN